MGLIARITTHLFGPATTARHTPPPVAQRREWASCTKTPEENFKTMALLYSFLQVDSLGRWWRIETRQCQFTGVILRRTWRVTD